MKNTVTRIFLDSKDWISLARVTVGKETEPVLKSVYQKITELSDSDEALFPFSIFHLEDLMKKTNKTKRESVIDTMIAISKGWVMKPFMLFTEKEIENAALRRLGMEPLHDIESEIIGRGLAYTAGLEYQITSTDPELQKYLDENEQELRNLLDSTESMAKLLKDDELCSFFRQGNKMYLALALMMEKDRKQRRTWKKTERYDNELRVYFINRIAPHLTKFLQELQVDSSTFFKTKNDIKSFLEDMSSSNILLHLSYARDEESPERDIRPNDQVDIAHLAGAVPYCDIVVMEKMFASLCRRQKLDEKYGAVVLTSLQQLNDVL